VGIRYLKQSELPGDGVGSEFVGREYGGVGACVIIVDAAPGEGPRLHRHPYVELLVVLEGIATFHDGTGDRVVHAGEMAVVDANQAHGFVNSGPGRLRQVDVHLSPQFVTEWLDPERG
jgi:mannose-6-phosphate isomerase-like protein (cupin superfamily)